MEKQRFRFRLGFTAILFLLGSVAMTSSAFCAGYPDHPIQLVCPNVPGAPGDIAARMLAEELGPILGQKVIVNNKPGAGTALAAETVLRSKKDGYTILYSGNSAFVYVPNVNPEAVHYDPVKDADPLGVHFVMPTVVSVRSDAPWKTFAQLVDYAKKNPGKLRFSSIGVGSQPHFGIELLQMITGIQVTHIPFKGGESVVTAVLGGHVEATLDGIGKLKPHMDAGTMRTLIIDPKRPENPEIPTLQELGYRSGLPAVWFGVWAPAGIPEDVRAILVPAVEKALRLTKPRVEQLGNTFDYRPPAEHRRLQEEEYRQAYEVAVKIGLRK
jgi:tripartite-type tricarboxylate transporter receptor subunit TctC